MTVSIWDEKLPAMSLHRIRDTSMKGLREVSEIVDRVKTFYQQNNRERFADQTLEIQPVEVRDWRPERHYGFTISVLFLRRKEISGFGRKIESIAENELVGLEEITISFVIFLYRTRENDTEKKMKPENWDAYSLTTRVGWQMIKPFCDSQFPINLALRVLEPKLMVLETKNIAGDKNASTETFRAQYRLQEYEHQTLWRIFKVFSSKVKVNSSLAEYLEMEDNDAVVVRVGRGNVLVQKSLSLAEQAKVLDLMSKIHRGEKTTTRSGDEESEDPNFRFIRNILPVDKEVWIELDRQLCGIIYEFVMGKKPMPEGHFCHRYYADFLRSNWFELRHSDRKIFWNSAPSIEEVFALMKILFFRGSRVDRSREAFSQFLGEVYFSFSGGARHCRNFKILEFIQTEIQSSQTGEMYFRNDGMWFRVAASHLVTMNGAFYQTLGAVLMSEGDTGMLCKPWIQDRFCASFDVHRATKFGVDPAEFQSVIDLLRQRRMPFVEEKGSLVRVPYVTDCILTEIKESNFKSDSKIVDKRWATISLTLGQFYTAKTALTKKDLEEVFQDARAKNSDAEKGPSGKTEGSRKSRGNALLAERVMSILQKSYPLVDRTRIGTNTLSPAETIIENNKVVVTDLQGMELVGGEKATGGVIDLSEKERNFIEKELKKIQDRGEEFKAERLISRLESIKVKKRKAKRIAQGLLTGGKRYLVIPDQYVVQMPPFKNHMLQIKVSDVCRKFFELQHEYYRSICKEEGYSRQFLAEPGYLVGDQVYASEKEKVELYDLLFFDESTEKLFLYHIKANFGQPTREACAQIRIAAQTVQKDIHEGFPLLKMLFDRIWTKQPNSLFESQLQDQYKKLGVTQDEACQKFLRMFANKKKIVFVYAFIDTGKNKRHLSQEKDPKHKFKNQEFSTRSAGVVDKLVSKGFLSRDRTLTTKFFRSSFESFEEEFRDLIDFEAKSVYETLEQWRTQFNSIGAKLELVHLKDHMQENYDFQFRILQIPRSPDTFDGEGIYVPRAEFSGPTTVAPDISYCGFSFKLTGPEVDLATCTNGMFPSAILSKELLIYKKLLELQDNPEIIRLLSERLPSGSVEEKIKEYTTKIWLQGKIDIQDIELLANIFGIHILVFEGSGSPDDEMSNDEENLLGDFNIAGSPIYCFVKRQSDRFVFGRSLDAQECPEMQHEFALKDIFEYFPSTIPIGISNSSGTDCFMNAILQCIIHSSLVLDFAQSTSRWSAQRDEKDHNWEQRVSFYRQFDAFIQRYIQFGLKNKSSCHSSGDLRDAVSELDRTNPNGMKAGYQDVTECFSFVGECFNMNEYRSQVLDEWKVDVTMSQWVEATQKQLEDSEYIQPDNSMPAKRDQKLVLELPLIAKDCDTFTTCLDRYTQEEELKEFKYRDGDSRFSSQATKTSSIETLGEKGVFISYKRFDWIGDQRQKIATRVNLDRLDQSIANCETTLRWFIVHIGNSADSGHYKAYVRSEADDWHEFDDARVTEKREEEILQIVKDAYLMYFEKKAV